MKDSALKTCPKDMCRMRSWGKGKVRRLMSAGAGLIFKGTGFYITDYRSENYKQAAKKESEAASPPKTDSATKTDSAAKTDSTAKKETPAKKPTKAKDS
jgi:predicted nucleic acid-binding Zn ribbon protein